MIGDGLRVADHEQPNGRNCINPDVVSRMLARDVGCLWRGRKLRELADNLNPSAGASAPTEETTSHPVAL
jgi:hypothetical protein